MRIVAILLILASVTLSGCSGSDDAGGGLMLERLAAAPVNHDALAVSVVDPVDGKALVDHQAAAPAKGGSTQKLITSFAALVALGGKESRATQLRQGTAPGEVVLYGARGIRCSAKPTWTDSRPTTPRPCSRPPQNRCGSVPTHRCSPRTARLPDGRVMAHTCRRFPR